jgi:hypothetical protein
MPNWKKVCSYAETKEVNVLEAENKVAEETVCFSSVLLMLFGTEPISTDKSRNNKIILAQNGTGVERYQR